MQIYQYAILVFYAAIFAYLGYVDFKKRIVPNKIVIPAIPVAVLLNIFVTHINWREIAFGAGIALFLGFLFLLISSGKLGGGDFKLMIFAGVSLGSAGIPLALFLSIIIGACIAIFLLVLKVRKVSDTLMFGPLLSGAAILTLILMAFGINTITLGLI